MFVNIRGYVYLVPFVYDREKEEAFLKTIIPSRKHIPLLIRFDSTATNDTNLHELHKT
ncbi:MAG: hypothetical protein AB7S75_04715 [Desulfococcaceae bacterium]